MFSRPREQSLDSTLDIYRRARDEHARPGRERPSLYDTSTVLHARRTQEVPQAARNSRKSEHASRYGTSMKSTASRTKATARARCGASSSRSISPQGQTRSAPRRLSTDTHCREESVSSIVLNPNSSAASRRGGRESDESLGRGHSGTLTVGQSGITPPENESSRVNGLGQRRRFILGGGGGMLEPETSEKGGRPAARTTLDTARSPTHSEQIDGQHKNPASERARNETDGAARERDASVASIRRRVRSLQTGEGQAHPAQGAGREREVSSSASETDEGTAKHSSIFVGHEGQVLVLARHEDIIFSSAADGTAKAWDTETLMCLATFEGHHGPVWGMEATGRTLITAGADATVRFWVIETTQLLQTIDVGLPVRDISLVGQHLAVATSAADIELISLSDMQRHSTLQGHILAVSSLSAFDDGERLVSGSHDTFIRVWRLASGQCEAHLGGHSGTIGALSTAPSHRVPDHSYTLPAREEAEGLLVSGSGDSSVRVWKWSGRRKPEQWTCLAVLLDHSHGVWAVHILPRFAVFATGSGDGTAKVWVPVTAPDRTGNLGVNGTGDQLCGWECVGGVRGTVGSVGAVLLSEDDLLFGTTEALIASFPLELCMPAHQ